MTSLQCAAGAALVSLEVHIEYTGLRPGEKMHEALFSEGEIEVCQSHLPISHVGVPALAVWDLDSEHLCSGASIDGALRRLAYGIDPGLGHRRSA